jgi:hypothetical protein
MNLENEVLFEKEIFFSISTEVVHMQTMQVADVCAKKLDTTQKVDQQTPNLDLSGSWSDIGDFGHMMYTDEKENAIAINYLKNRAADRKEPFTEVVFKGNKNKGNPVITRARGRNLLVFFFLSFICWCLRATKIYILIK